MEYDQLTASSEWRWYIGNRRGEWRKSRRIAKKELMKEMILPKESKKDPDILKTKMVWTWGPERYYPRFSESTKESYNEQ